MTTVYKNGIAQYNIYTEDSYIISNRSVSLSGNSLSFDTTLLVLTGNSVNIGTNVPESSAILNVQSTTKGFLPPKMGSVTGITSPAIALQVYQTGATEGQYVNLSTGWKRFLTDADIGTTITSNNIYNSDGTLTGNRTIDFNSYTLVLSGNTRVNGELRVDSTTNGFLPPRWTEAQKLGIVTPATGLVGYQTDVNESLYVKKSTAWKKILTEDEYSTLQTQISTIQVGNNLFNFYNFR